MFRSTVYAPPPPRRVHGQTNREINQSLFDGHTELIVLEDKKHALLTAFHILANYLVAKRWVTGVKKRAQAPRRP
jgi:hypothetical protein